MIKIGQVVQALAISADTLRYYEKIGLMPGVRRNNGGARLYSDKDLSRLRFIKRAQKMGFSLDEIDGLLSFRDNSKNARPNVRKMARLKLAEIEHHLSELEALRDELRLLTNLCGASTDGCPILESFERADGS
jgi:DNA-binding transcriptional MerR regulator